MKFTRLSIANFLTIGEAEINLADRGLVLLQGANLDDTSADSNGAGKSSIADALCWALYGTTARGVEGDAVINRFVGKGCRVSVRVEDGSSSWLIARHRKDKVGKNSLVVFDLTASPEVELTRGTDKLTQELVNEIVGSSYEVFRSSIYAGQENFPDLPSMTDKQLKLLIEEAAGTTVLEKAYEAARAAGNEAKLSSDQSGMRLRSLEADLVRARENVEHAETNSIDAETTRKADAGRYALAIQNDAKLLKELRERIAAADLPGLETKIEACDAAVAAVEDERIQERRLAAALGAKEREMAAFRAELVHIKNQAENQKVSLDNIGHQVGCPCTTCDRLYTEADIAPAREIAQKRLSEIVSTFKVKRSNAEGAAIAQKGALDALEAFRASMTDLSANSAQRASIQALIDTARNMQRDESVLIREISTNRKHLERVKTTVNPYAELLTKARQRVVDIEAAMAKAEEDTVKKAADLKLAELVTKVFSPAGVRAHILDTVTPFLNERTARYLSVLSDDNITASWVTLAKTAKGELREKFSIEVANAHGGSSFASISGGEKRKVKLAAALALQDLVASRASKPIELFIGDEIDDALDNAGRERLMTILEERARERGSVFVISHSDLRMWISQCVVITKKDNISTLEEMAV